MRAGILALDGEGKLVLMNDAAREILAAASGRSPTTLGEISAPLAEAYATWFRTGDNPTHALAGPNGNAALVSFTEIAAGDQRHTGTLVFLEDAAETRQRAQQFKLASLGRLTASIAHEIRNPLGAISHAGQLLSESTALDAEDRRLIEIMLDHTGRVNGIIENVLMLGRRKDVVPESFDLVAWCVEFARELTERHALDRDALAWDWETAPIPVRMDRAQLHQVLWNLCENGLRYARVAPRLRFRGGIAEHGRPYLEICDSGPGLTPAMADRLFEPFATSEPSGTGLGLYIARELCESNQAALQLLPSAQGCRFRITFAHPNRQQRTGEL